MSEPQMLYLVQREIVRNLEEERERRAHRRHDGVAARRTSWTAWSAVVGRLTGRGGAPSAVCCCPA